MSKHLTITPRMSEKAYAASQSNTYVFVTPKSANKNQITAAVEAQYGVVVSGIKTSITKGKVMRGAVKGGRAFYKGARSDFKKAYVTLAEGHSIKLFEEEGK